MKSTVELDIEAPRDRVAALFNDPNNNPKWMDDIARIEPIKGPLGEPGSVYRFVPKDNPELSFVATVVAREPAQTRLLLENPNVTVAITDEFRELSSAKTKLISQEVFNFKGLFSRIYGFVGALAIKRAHRQHMEAFKRFAETHA